MLFMDIHLCQNPWVSIKVWISMVQLINLSIGFFPLVSDFHKQLRFKKISLIFKRAQTVF